MLRRKRKIITFCALVLFIFPINCQDQDRKFYILIWTVTTYEGWIYRGLDREDGQEAFLKRKCSFQNCYMTTNRTYLNSVLDFDVLLFSAVHLSRLRCNEDLPFHRSERQLYGFFSIEPAAYNSIAYSYFQEFFNVTWTYILNSDIVNPYFFVKNLLGEIVAPRTHAHWMNIEDIAPINKTIEEKLKFKSIAAVWVGSNCRSRKRFVFIRSLNDELSKYGHRVDIYGKCGDQTNCQKVSTERNGVLNNCYSKIESDYYFYMAFENSFTEDYVSEKVLHGLLHFSVPVVYGGADYTRFLPDGIYLNALELGVEGLAKEMNDIINDPKRYYDFFKWHGYYSFHDTGADDYRESVCAFCSFLNKRTINSEIQVYKNITGWWNAPYPELFPNAAYTDGYPTTIKPAEVIESQVEIPPPPPQPSNVFEKIMDLFLDDS